MEFGVRTLEDNLLIGFVALHSIEWNNRTASLAVGIGEDSYRNKGYGTEAIKLILHYAFNELNLNRVGLDVISNNEAAIRSYEKCGFVAEGVVRKGVIRDRQELDRIYMGILYEEWEKTKVEILVSTSNNTGEVENCQLKSNYNVCHQIVIFFIYDSYSNWKNIDIIRQSPNST